MSNFIDNPELHAQYNMHKYNLLGSKTKEDAFSILEKYKLDSKCRNLMLSLMQAKKYDHALDNSSMKKYINEISACEYKEDAFEIINQILQQTSDMAQIRTFNRLADPKPNRTYVATEEVGKKNNLTSKKCPHCGYKCIATRNTAYIVCGYGNSGFDWEGCGKDWCFKCGKMLCKSWEQDQLYLPTNRFHDTKCCKKHATLHSYKYPENYCRCCTVFVSRNQ